MMSKLISEPVSRRLLNWQPEPPCGPKTRAGSAASAALRHCCFTMGPTAMPWIVEVIESSQLPGSTSARAASGERIVQESTAARKRRMAVSNGSRSGLTDAFVEGLHEWIEEIRD